MRRSAVRTGRGRRPRAGRRGENQQFTLPDAGQTGEVRADGGTLCVDAAGGAGDNRDRIIVWECHGGANQQWTRTAAGELRGIKGRCVDVERARTHDLTPVILYDCHGGPNQTWSAAPARPPVVTTLFGANIWQQPGETYLQALERSNATYGGLDVVRVFYNPLPARWPGRTGPYAGPLVVSFKGTPQNVAAGEHDAFFRDWFATAPWDRDVYWTYYHEPEDNIEGKEGERFTAPDYRAAWARLDQLAAAAGNPRLHSTLILMCYTLEPASGRNWRDYYAGPDVIDVLGWDCYNAAASRGRYAAPESVGGRAIATSQAEGKPWGIAELGSLLVAGDDGTGRATWLRETAAYLKSHGAAWVAYFDAPVGREFRLLDGPSQRAWREVVTTY